MFNECLKCIIVIVCMCVFVCGEKRGCFVCDKKKVICDKMECVDTEENNYVLFEGKKIRIQKQKFYKKTKILKKLINRRQ